MARSKRTTHASNVNTETIISPEQSRKINMGVSPGAMRFIIDRLTDQYTNPIVSSVREVISNAIDATMRMPEGDRRAVEIISPGVLSPVFKVVDHGVGMDATDLEERFTQYGGSDKADDFDQLGAYGLGAKSPLAYCNEFNVETTKNGITTSLTISRENYGNTAEIYSSIRTGRPSGTTISIPVDSGDEDKFNNALDNYRKYQSDVPIKVDGKLIETTGDYVPFDSFTLDEDEDIVGRVWVNPELFNNALVPMLQRGSYDHTFDFLLSGWCYRGSSRQWGVQEGTFLVELKPGILDFSSSRDEITQNKRSYALLRRLQEKYNKLNKENIDRLMEYYRTLPESTAWRVYSDLNLHVKNDTAFLKVGHSYYNQNPQKHEIPVEDFTTKDGFNPIRVVNNEKPKQVFGIVVLTGENGRDYSFIPSSETTKDNTNNHFYYRSTRPTFGETSGNIRKAVEGKDTASLFDFYFSKNKHLFQASRNVTVVEGVDVDLVDTFVKYRLVTAKYAYPNAVLLFTDSPVLDEDKELVAKVHKMKVDTVSSEDFLEAIEEARKTAANSRKKDTGEERPLDGYHHAVIKDDVTAINKRSDGKGGEGILYGVTDKLLLSEIIADEDVVLGLSSRSHAADVVRGAVNRGADLTNKNIYVFERNAGWLAKHFEQLKDYDLAFFDNDFVAHSKIGKEVVKPRRRRSGFFSTEVAELDVSNIVHLYLDKHFHYSWSRRTDKNVWKGLANLEKDKDLKRIYNLFAKAEPSKDRSNYQGTEDELLQAKLSEKDFTLFTVVADEAKNIIFSNYDTSLQRTAFTALFGASKVDNQKIFDFLLGELQDHFAVEIPRKVELKKTAEKDAETSSD